MNAATDQAPVPRKPRKRRRSAAQKLKAVNKAKARYIKNNPTKRRAHRLVENGLRNGSILKGTECCECHTPATEKRVIAHHDDYAQPLAIRWMCDKCHRAWHNLHGEALNP